MSRQAKMALAVLGIAILIAVLMVVLRPTPEELPRDDRAPLVSAVPFKPETGPLAVLGSGTVQAREEVTVGAEVAGRLVFVNPAFREGSLISAGATLFRIDPADYQNRVRSAQADVAAQDVAVLQAREEAEIAKDELRRFANRQDQGNLIASTIDGNDYASRIKVPHSLADEAAAASRKAGQTTPPARLATREPQLRSARAARERAGAQLADARLALGRTSVRAPFTGIVRNETAATGKLVQPGQELGSIVSTASFEVRVSLTEDEAALVPGLLNGGGGRIPASVSFDYGGLTYRWSAFVDRADAILDSETRTIDIFLNVPNPLRGGVRQGEGAVDTAPPLLIGSFVRAEITGASIAPFAAVPSQALRPGNEIWVVREGKLVILPVRVIQRTDTLAYVTTPTIALGGQIVTSALRAPVNGMKVRIDRPRATPAQATPKAGSGTGARTGARADD